MGYLIAADYNRQIKEDNLAQVISNDNSILVGAELAAQSEMISYLVQKYDTTKEFKPTLPFSDLATYKGDDLVYYGTAPNISLYYATLPAEEFDYKKYYNTGDIVFYKDKTYTCLIASVCLSHEAELQYITIQNIPYGNVFPDDPVSGEQYWGVGTPYSFTGILPTDTTKWTQGDNRNQQLVMFMVDIVLYHVNSRISPRNIPQLRMDRYDAAITWLKNVAKGDDITADIPKKQPAQGNRNRYGGNVKNINTY